MDAVDWQTGKTPLECTRYMLDNQVNCDVNFKVGDDEENIKAHKFILSLRSAVFDRMFDGSFCGSEKDPVIPDVTSAAFKMLLRYCYYECLDIEDDIALAILYAATKYMLPLLAVVAREKLIEALSSSNVWSIYKYAINVGDTTLLEGCHEYFQGNTTSVKEALQAEAFLDMPHRVLLDLMHNNDNDEFGLDELEEEAGDNNPPIAARVAYRNYVGISISEIELFNACHKWAEAECLRQEIDPTGANKRMVLGDCLFLIRFPTMLCKDLVNVVFLTGLLNPTEKDNLSQYKHSETASQCQGDFASRQRQFVVTAPEPSFSTADASTVFIESEERVMLSRLWIRGTGRYRVTVRDQKSQESWSMISVTKHLGHCTKPIEDIRRIVYVLDIKPQLLDSHNKYAITAERMESTYSGDKNIHKVEIWELVPFKEVKMTRIPGTDNSIHAVTLCLV